MDHPFSSNYEYYYVMSIMMCLLTLSMAIAAFKNKQVPDEKRKGFGVPFILVGVVIVIDIITVRLREVNYPVYTTMEILETAQLAIAPIIILYFANHTFLIERIKFVSTLMHIMTVISMVLCVLNIRFHVYFYVDANGFNYQKLYWFYSAIWVAGIFYMISSIWKFMNYYQCRNATQLNVAIVFMIAGLSLHLIDSNWHFSWFASSISLVMFYLHYKNIMDDVDPITELLCQGAWANEVKHLDRKATVIIFDINDFKITNDTYGHQEGDEIIKVVAKCLKRSFLPYGYCYRIGGDEFAVLMTNLKISPELACKNFVKVIDLERQKRNTIPTVSYGYAVYNPIYIDSTIYDIIKSADDQMYRYKKRVKEEKALAALQEGPQSE